MESKKRAFEPTAPIKNEEQRITMTEDQKKRRKAFMEKIAADLPKKKGKNKVWIPFREKKKHAVAMAQQFGQCTDIKNGNMGSFSLKCHLIYNSSLVVDQRRKEEYNRKSCFQ